jgi:molybdate transport system ATP-binding protein
MAYRPQALLLDEPFSAMDYFLKEKLRLEMKQVLQKYEGLSVLVTHDRDEAYQLCDHLLLMHEGSVIAVGPTKELFDHPGTVEAARLTGCKNISRIRPLGPHRICALDWDNLELTTGEEVTDEITHAGIRAHDFFPCGSENVENRIPLEKPVLTELPFEWYIVLQNKIWLKIPKDIRSHDFSESLPRALCVDPSAIMLLSQ